jgi:glucose-1-phosphate thymidylyltransferase
MWGIIPAAAHGNRIQPLASVSKYVLERMIRGGADRICVVIAAAKSDILEYFGASFGGAALVYVVQPEPAGLCDAIFRASPLIADDECVAVGLPDTIWFPDHGLAALPDDELSFLLFPVERPELFDAVLLDRNDRVREVRVKHPQPGTHWIWGAFKMPGHIFHELRGLWLDRGCADEYFGTLVNAYLESGGRALGRKEGHAYVDVGTLEGYRAAMMMLSTGDEDDELFESGSRSSRDGTELRP